MFGALTQTPVQTSATDGSYSNPKAESLSNWPQVNSPVELKVRADPLFSVY